MPRFTRTPVIIIGGGIAGLAAAARLAAQGIPATLLEAKARLGGRVHTIYQGSTPIELGAEFIHGQNKALMKTIHEARLSVREVCLRHLLFSEGTLKKQTLFQAIEEVFDAIDLRKPDQSFRSFLDAHVFDEQARQIALHYVEGFNAAHADRISVHALLHAEQAADRINGSWQGRLTRGYAGLVRFLERRINNAGGRILPEAVVKRVTWKEGSAEVVYSHRGKPKTETGSAVIVTLPIGIWKSDKVVFQPAFTEKRHAAHELEFGNVSKIILQFRRQWWPKSLDGFIHAPAEPLPTWWTSGALLTGWAGGPHADVLLRLSPARLKALCLDVLSRIFSEPRSRLESRLLQVHTYDWLRDPDVRGAYSYIPVNGLELPKILAAPLCDTLFFAGEAMVFDAQTGTVFGALESGLRAADEVIKHWRETR